MVRMPGKISAAAAALNKFFLPRHEVAEAKRRRKNWAFKKN